MSCDPERKCLGRMRGQIVVAHRVLELENHLVEMSPYRQRTVTHAAKRRKLLAPVDRQTEPPITGTRNSRAGSG